MLPTLPTYGTAPAPHPVGRGDGGRLQYERFGLADFVVGFVVDFVVGFVE